MNKLISIVTPTYNEEDNIKKLCFDIAVEMKKLDYDYEHIVIDNKSSDSTISILKDLAKKDKKLKVIINSRNFGHIKSPVHGLLQAKGDAIILMSSDFQDPINLIEKFITEWKNGYAVVMAQKDTTDENYKKHFVKNIYYKLMKSISEVSLLTNTTGAGLYDRKIIEIVRSISDPYPYFRGLIPEITSNIKLIPFHQPKRLTGKTKNNFYTLYDIGVLGIVKHSKVPLRITTFLGLIASLLSILVAATFFVRKLLNWESFDLGIAPLTIGLFLLASVQIFFLGFIGEYVMNILIQTRKLPLVIEEERINF
jgi:glycosyltransferase involved in cell wall biosynthesis